MRVALAHDWLTGMRGGERVLEALLELFPDAPLYTLVHREGSVSELIESRPIHTSFIQDLPLGRTRYRYFLPLFPRAVEAFDLSSYDLVVSTSHCVAKGVRTGDVPHLCYCHTPMRYAWDRYHEYFGPGRAGPLVRAAAPAVTRRLRRWDVRTADRVDAFVANSGYVQGRIRRYYDRDAAVVHPPVDVHRFRPAPVRDDFHLVVSALVPYKRIDLAVEAFTRTGRRLVVVGDGTEEGRLRALAGPTVEFRGRVSDAEVARLMSRCCSVLMPGVEDFGIVAVEAQAAGAPVVARAEGGTAETVTDVRVDPEGGSGVLVEEGTVEAVMAAVETVEERDLDPERISRSVQRFAPERFRSAMSREIATLLERSGR